VCGLVLADMSNFPFSRNVCTDRCCGGSKDEGEWEYEKIKDLPSVSLKYPNHPYDDLKEKYFLDEDPNGSYAELCHQLQEFISADCFAVTIENDEPYDPKYIGAIPGKTYSKKQWRSKPSAVWNRHSLEILFNTYRFSGMIGYQQKIMNNVIREKLYTNIHHNFLCEVIRSYRPKLIKIYMFDDSPFAVHIRYNPDDKVFSVSLFRSIDHLMKFKSKEYIDHLIATPLVDNGDNEEDAELGDSLPIPKTSIEELDTELNKIADSRKFYYITKMMIDF
jgi:hypothetical protein